MTKSQAVEIAAMTMVTDFESSFQDSCIKVVGSDMTKAAASTVFKKVGISPNDVQVIELHDCFRSK